MHTLASFLHCSCGISGASCTFVILMLHPPACTPLDPAGFSAVVCTENCALLCTEVCAGPNLGSVLEAFGVCAGVHAGVCDGAPTGVLECPQHCSSRYQICKCPLFPAHSAVGAWVQGVLYSHRSNFLHAIMVASQDVMGLSSTSCFYAIVPLFHANSWGLVFAAPMTGARLVLPGQ